MNTLDHTELDKKISCLIDAENNLKDKLSDNLEEMTSKILILKKRKIEAKSFSEKVEFHNEVMQLETERSILRMTLFAMEDLIKEEVEKRMNELKNGRLFT